MSFAVFSKGAYFHSAHSPRKVNFILRILRILLRGLITLSIFEDELLLSNHYKFTVFSDYA
jgi:hypothetical protein